MKTPINKLLLSVMIIFSFSSLIACSNDNKQDKEASVNACLFDPTGNCARAVMAQCQANPAQCNSLASSPAVAPYLNGQNPQAGTQFPPTVLPSTTATGTPTYTGPGTQIQSAVQKKAAQVQAAIDADNNNPDSLHYDPPAKQIQAALDNARLPAQVQAAFSTPAQVSQPDDSGDGVAAR